MFRGRRAIRERLRDLAQAVLRPSGPSAPLSRWNWAFDAGLAFALGLIAILTAGNDDVPREAGPLPPGTFPTLPPEWPLPPDPEPYVTGPWAEWSALALLLVFIAAPLAFRRRYPLSMLWVVLVTASFTVDVGDETPLRLSFYACVIAAYSAAVYSPYRIPALASLPAAAFLFQEFQSDANEPALPGAITAVPQSAVPFLILLPIGVAAVRAAQLERSRADDDRARVSALEREQAEAVRRATEQERARIARELHDVVTHNVSVMVIQAGAARKVLDSEPARAREALLAVEAGGRAAMTELRHVMGLLTMDSDESEPELAPQPGLSQVEPLVERVRDAGVPVELVVTGAAGAAAGRRRAGRVPGGAGGADEHGEARGGRRGGGADRLRRRPAVDRGHRRRRPGVRIGADGTVGHGSGADRPARAPRRVRRDPAGRAANPGRVPGRGGHPVRHRGRGAAAGGDSVTEPVRVVVADDQALVRTGFRMILTADGIDVVAEATNGAEAVDAVRRTCPDVVLMDIRMPELDGLEATRRILAGDRPGPRVLMLTTFDLDQYVYAALSAGASGFLLKDVTPEHLVAAVRLVRSGDALLAPTITRRLVERFARRDEDAAAVHRDLAALTPREREVLQLLARGLSNAELAAQLHLSEATVKTHVARILGKLNLRDRVQAVVVAYETGLVTPGEA